MSLPDPKDVFVDHFLTDVLQVFTQEQTNYIADRAFPMVETQQESGIFVRYDKDDWLRTEAEKRSPASESRGTGWRIDKTLKYFADQISVHVDIDPRLRANQQDPVSVDEHAATLVAQQLMIKRDRIWADSFFTTGLWSTDLTGVAAAPGAGQFLQWNDPTSTPIKDITDAAEDIGELTGRRPNKLVLNSRVFNELRQHPDILDRKKFSSLTTSKNVDEALLAQIFDLDEVMVARAVENTANEGAATSSTNYVLDKGALLIHATNTPSLLVPSAGYTIAWTGLMQQSAFSGRVSRFEMPERNRATRIEGDLAFDMQVVAPDLGVFFDSAIA